MIDEDKLATAESLVREKQEIDQKLGEFLEEFYEKDLKEIRKRAGLSLRELARRADLSHVFLLKVERGKKRPSYEAALRIIAALNGKY